jgi:hypothetical protein
VASALRRLLLSPAEQSSEHAARLVGRGAAAEGFVQDEGDVVGAQQPLQRLDDGVAVALRLGDTPDRDEAA